MEILVEISEDEYATLLSRLTEDSSVYSVLKNALVFEHPNGGSPSKAVGIPCGIVQAKMLLHLAEKICPEAASKIEDGMSRPPRRLGK